MVGHIVLMLCDVIGNFAERLNHLCLYERLSVSPAIVPPIIFHTI